MDNPQIHLFNTSRGHLKQIKDRLANLSKGSLTIVKYMQAIKQCTDKLAAMEKPMDNEDIVDKIRTGLDYEAYKPIIDAVNARDTAISFEELHEKLITREIIVNKQHDATPISMFPATAIYARFRTPTVNNKQPWAAQPPLLPTPRQQSPARPQRPYLGKCQWCRVQGHALNHCPSFKTRFPTIQISSPTQARAVQVGR